MSFNATASALPTLIQHNSGGFAFFPINILTSSFFATSSQIDELVEASASFVLDAGINNELFFRIPATGSGQNGDIITLYMTSSGVNPRVGVGTTEPLTVFDFKDIEDSSAGTELLLRSSRTSEGAQVGDSAGRINFAIDSSSYGKIKTSGSIATIEALVSDVDTTGVTGDLVLSTANVKNETPVQRIKIGVTTEITGTLNTSVGINAKTKISSSTLETSGFLSADSLGVGTTIPPGTNTLKVEGAAIIDGDSTLGSSDGSITTISGSLKTTNNVYIPGIGKTSGTDNVVIMDSGYLRSASVDDKIFANPNTLVSRNAIGAIVNHIPFYTTDTTVLTSSTSLTFNPSTSTLGAPGFIATSDLFAASARISTTNIFTTNLTASIISASGAVISNELTASGLNYPSADGTDGQVIMTDGSGILTFNDVSVYAQVKNVTGGTLAKGTPVHASGSTGNTSEVIAASASVAATMPATFVLAEELAAEEEGRAIVVGYINGVNTSPFNEGDVVYVGANGGYTNVKPTGSNLIQNLGIVTKVDASNGSGFIYGAGRSNDVPNITSGYAWVGNSDQVATAVATSSFVVDNANTASYVALSPTTIQTEFNSTGLSSAGEFQPGARLALNAYGTNPSATAGTIVSFGNTNVAAVGAQSTAAAAKGRITVVTDAADGDELILEGVVKMSTNTGWSTAKLGTAVYMSTTAGQVTTTAPSTSGDYVRIVGHVISGTNAIIYFNPENGWIEVA